MQPCWTGREHEDRGVAMRQLTPAQQAKQYTNGMLCAEGAGHVRHCIQFKILSRGSHVVVVQ